MDQRKKSQVIFQNTVNSIKIKIQHIKPAARMLTEKYIRGKLIELNVQEKEDSKNQNLRFHLRTRNI